MVLEEKKQKLQAYLLTVARLERKCEEAARWDSLAKAGEEAGTSRIRTTALQLRGECEQLALKANALRLRLTAALEQLPDPKQRELLAAHYLNGISVRTLAMRNGWTERYTRRMLAAAVNQLADNNIIFYC